MCTIINGITKKRIIHNYANNSFFCLSIVSNGGEKTVTLDNVDEYVSAVLDFTLDYGIRRQMNAFRKGFNAVFPIERLGSFAPEEVNLMACDNAVLKTNNFIIE